MQSFSEKFIFVWESADLVMSWHAPCLPKWRRYHPLFFYQTPFPLKSENCPTPTPCHHPILVRVSPPLLTNQIFQWTPIIKLKVTKFLVKLSQFKFLVNTDKNIFVFIFFHEIFQILVYFLCKNWTPSRRRGWGEVHYFRSTRITC